MMVWQWLRAKLGLRKNAGPEAVEVRALTDQFYITLQAYVTKIKASSGPKSAPALERVEKLLAKPVDERRWPNAYDIEQQIVQLFDEQTLEAELGRRLVEVKQALHPNVSAWYVAMVQKTTDPEGKRALLARMVNDLQWRYTKDETRRGYITQITKRTEIVFTSAVVLFAVSVFLIFYGPIREWAGDLQLLMPFAGLCGMLGATFSMMYSLGSRLEKSTLDDLKLNTTWGMILARALVGIGAGMILYFFMRSGLLRGDMFPWPDGSGGQIVDAAPAPADLGKLVVWCLIAGFSEQLIPNLLARTEQAGVPPAVAPTGQPPDQLVPQTLPHTDRAPHSAPAQGNSTERREEGPRATQAQSEPKG